MSDALRRKVSGLPTSPGVYLFKDDRGKVVYVGKAGNLRTRVRAYLRPEGDGRAHIPHLIEKIADVDFITTGNEKEALLLEDTLVKTQRPRYNIKLRDDKAYLCIRVDIGHAWPRIHMVRKFKRDGALYFGPFSSAKAVRRTIRTLGAVYPLRLCTDHTLETRGKPCLYHQLKRCCAPCVAGMVTKEEYDGYVQGMLDLLRGRTAPLLKRLNSDMDEASEQMQFERAASLRDQIDALEKTTVAQRVASADGRDRDVIGLARRGEVATAAVMHVRDGRLLSKRTLSFRTILPDGAILSKVLHAVYRSGRLVPPEIILPTEPEDAERLEAEYRERRGSAVNLRVPHRGPARALLELATDNARQEVKQAEGDEQQREALLRQLKERLELRAPPRRIECYDISTIQGSQTVGSRVVFEDARPDKDGYRRFRVKTVSGQDDFAAMREVLTRRFYRDESRPDLIVIDGGPEQLNAVLDLLPDGVEAVGLAKARTNRTGERTAKILPPDGPETYLLARIRDEAHRFAITYHRRLRSKRTVRSALDEIPGLGPKRRTLLLRTFGSTTGVRNATEEELLAAGLPKNVVEAIRAWSLKPEA
ncbi:MAG: excinuclease ABC subunit UvrC [Planctomycetota bacterium]|jgi:excinuclease ABC subunit C